MTGFRELALLALISSATADIYMHNPRGSNGRACRNSNNAARNGDEAARLFDSQNNDNGGYSCQNNYPFPCYNEQNETARAACNALNANAGKEAVTEDGKLIHPDAVVADRMYYYAGSVLPIEWTVQHGSGMNGKVNSDIIIQVACEQDEPDRFSFTDDCGVENGGKKCLPRDGQPVNNQDATNTQRVPMEAESQDDYRYGRHESYRYYQECLLRERNKGLFLADQEPNSNSATATRQNPNGSPNNRNGFECREERDYFPYWAPSPWIDVAIVTSDPDKCDRDREQSQNVVPKQYCKCTAPGCTNGRVPIQQRQCEEKGGSWETYPSWAEKFGDQVNAPACVKGGFSRQNHLGNVGQANGQPFYFNWTIPEFLAGKNRCVLRVRYNISTSDFGRASIDGDSQLNGDALTPLKDRNKNPADTYLSMTGGDGLCSSDACKLGMHINTNQYGRTFQDRSHTFSIRAPPEEPKCDRIYNLNTRGKRGNIVQAYPAVEYDFVPNHLELTTEDCVHIQWTGSDYNPDRNGNNGAGGPPNPNNINEAKADRFNLVQTNGMSENFMIQNVNELTMLQGEDNKDTYRRLAFLDQDMDNSNACLPYEQLALLYEGQNDIINKIDRDQRNCMKMNSQVSPYFDAGLVKLNKGTHTYMSTRNNNFSNRGQKGVFIVSRKLTVGEIVGITLGTLAALALLGLGGRAAFRRYKKRNTETAPANNYSVKEMLKVDAAKGAAAKRPASSSPTLVIVATALYARHATEAGELSFARGDKITVTKQDPSGWWEGTCDDGLHGLFPANYVVIEAKCSDVAATAV